MQTVRRIKAQPSRFIYNLYNALNIILIFGLFVLFNYLFVSNIRYLFYV